MNSGSNPKTVKIAPKPVTQSPSGSHTSCARVGIGARVFPVSFSNQNKRHGTKRFRSTCAFWRPRLPPTAVAKMRFTLFTLENNTSKSTMFRWRFLMKILVYVYIYIDSIYACICVCMHVLIFKKKIYFFIPRCWALRGSCGIRAGDRSGFSDLRCFDGAASSESPFLRSPRKFSQRILPAGRGLFGAALSPARPADCRKSGEKKAQNAGV